MKDFTSIIGMRWEPRGEILSALRECYDGHWERPSGGDGGKMLGWSGHLAVVARLHQGDRLSPPTPCLPPWGNGSCSSVSAPATTTSSSLPPWPTSARKWPCGRDGRSDLPLCSTPPPECPMWRCRLRRTVQLQALAQFAAQARLAGRT